MSQAVLKYDAACHAIAEAKTVDEVTEWIDKAAAVREYGRRIKNRQIEIDAIEIRVKAKRRRGELLLELKAEGRLQPGRPGEKELSSANDVFTLETLGISRNESSEEQRIAAIDGGSFARLVERCRAYAEAHPEKHSFDVLGEARQVDKKQARADREKILAGIQLSLPNKKYGVILADPEWRFKTYSRETGMDRAADNHYPTSETADICARPVGDIAAADCVLFLWATAPMLPDALQVMAAWGFAYKSHVVWKKDRIGTGYWLRNQHELLLIGTRGNIPAPAPGTQFPSVIDAPIGRHSEKPETFHELIEAYFPNLPKIELNARQARPGWDCWGAEAPAPELPAHDPETGEVIEDVSAPAELEAPIAEVDTVEVEAPIAEVPALELPADEFDRLRAFSDFCFPRRAEILEQLAPEYIERGLAYSIRLGEAPDWGLTEPGYRLFYRLKKQRDEAAPPRPALEIGVLPPIASSAPAPALEQLKLFAADNGVPEPEIVDQVLQCRMPLDEDELARLGALRAIAAGQAVEGEVARDLVGIGFAHATPTRLVITAEGEAFMAQFIDEPGPIEVPAFLRERESS